MTEALKEAARAGQKQVAGPARQAGMAAPEMPDSAKAAQRAKQRLELVGIALMGAAMAVMEPAQEQRAVDRAFRLADLVLGQSDRGRV